MVIVWETEMSCCSYVYTTGSNIIHFGLRQSLLGYLYCREPRGFGFVQYLDPDDAAEAKYQMDRQILLGRELTVVFAEENRKKPSEMRARERSR